VRLLELPATPKTYPVGFAPGENREALEQLIQAARSPLPAAAENCEPCTRTAHEAKEAKEAGFSTRSDSAVAPYSQLDSDGPEPPHRPEPMAPEAFHGLVGEVVEAIEPHSEADRHALLVLGLTAFGNYIGRALNFELEGDRHYTNLFACVVGPTAAGRKGTSWGQCRRVLALADASYVEQNNKAGLASGEGIIYHVRDANENPRRRAGAGSWNGDPGIADKRLLVVETEFASARRVMGRDGNTLSPRIRQVWDTVRSQR
jgi:hypothetical protein